MQTKSLSIAISAFLLLTASVSLSAATLKANGKVVFASDRDGNPEIYVMNPDGTNQVRLTNNNASDGMPCWSSDGTKIVFSTDRDGNGFQLYVMNADGSNQTRLTNNSDNDVEPTWSPDGTRIAFASDRDGSGYEIYVMQANGTNQVRITKDGVSDEDPTWSPDGTRIAFDSDLSGNDLIYVINPDGSNEKSLGTTEGAQASWSPDNSQIVYRSAVSSSNPQIFKMNADGTNVVQLTVEGASDQDPNWSPDGKKIIFATNRNGTYQLYSMNTDGSVQTRLTVNKTDDGGPNWQSIPIVQCPRIPFFWKTHAALWHVNSLKLGNKTYTKNQLRLLLDLPVGNDESLRLADQLIATKLSIANGAPATPIHAKVLGVDTLLSHFTGLLPYHVIAGTDEGHFMLTDAEALQKYTSGSMTPACVRTPIQ